MGKNSILDPLDFSYSMRKNLFKKKTIFYSILILILFSYLPGCLPLRVIVLRDPLTPEEHLNLGVVYERNGEIDHAIREYQKASHNLPIAYLYLGNAHFQKMEWAKAEAFYKKAIKKEPKNADAYNNLAWLYYTQREKLDEGERLVLKAIELNPLKESIYKDTLDKIRELKRLLTPPSSLHLPSSSGRLGCRSPYPLLSPPLWVQVDESPQIACKLLLNG